LSTTATVFFNFKYFLSWIPLRSRDDHRPLRFGPLSSVHKPLRERASASPSKPPPLVGSGSIYEARKMVFCGKPSGGCHACRARKTKCDQIPEGCTQCKRAKRACPGYRSKGSLIFRDESANVVRKLKAKELRTRQASFGTSVPQFSSEDDREPEIFLEIARSEELALSTYSLAPPIEDRGTFPESQALHTS
jgi:hypothetical protein